MRTREPSYLLKIWLGWKIGGPNESLTVFGRDGTPRIMKTISKRFVSFVREAGLRQTPRLKSIRGMNLE